MRKKSNAPDSLSELLGERRERACQDAPATVPDPPQAISGPVRPRKAAQAANPARKVLTIRMSQDLLFELKSFALQMQNEGEKDLATANAVVVRAVESFLALHREGDHD